MILNVPNTRPLTHSSHQRVCVPRKNNLTNIKKVLMKEDEHVEISSRRISLILTLFKKSTSTLNC